MSFYKAYRAVVRAKIALFNRNAPGVSEDKKSELMTSYEQYIELAESYSALPNRFMLTMNGVSGTGKSTIALRLVDRLGPIRIRSDIERKRLFGIAANVHPNADEAKQVYSEGERNFDFRLSVLGQKRFQPECGYEPVGATCPG